MGGAATLGPLQEATSSKRVSPTGDSPIQMFAFIGINAIKGDRMFIRFARLVPIMAVVAVASAAAPSAGAAQGWLDRAKQHVKDKVAEKTDQATDSVTDAAMSKTEHAVKCVISNRDCIRNAEQAGQQVAIVNGQGVPVSTADSANAIAAAGPAAGAIPAGASPAAAGMAPGGDVMVNYDFVPGDRVIFADDFTQDNVGDFPKRLELVEGNLEVAESQGQRMIRTTDLATIDIPLPETLPSRFTFEADYAGAPGLDLRIHFLPGGDATTDNAYVQCSPFEGGLAGSIRSSSEAAADYSGKVVHCRVMADGKYVKVYVNGKRVANAPNADLGRANKVWITMSATEDGPAYLSNVRIAAGGKPLYDALTADGHVATHGILFDTGSDQIRPESAPTLKQIGDMLAAHTDLKLMIEGHTDNVGAAATNQSLSDRRAASVKQVLVANYKVDASRL
jgi:outer membrane protein OmpA-like peptidoglycan-associated protein